MTNLSVKEKWQSAHHEVCTYQKDFVSIQLQIGEKIKEKPAIAYGERWYDGSLKPWGWGVGELLAWFGSRCVICAKLSYKSIQSCYVYIYPMMEHLCSPGSGLFQDVNTPNHRIQAVTECLSMAIIWSTQWTISQPKRDFDVMSKVTFYSTTIKTTALVLVSRRFHETFKILLVFL